MDVRPLYDRLLVKRKEPEERTRSGLFIPTTAQEKSNLAEVVAVGHGKLNKDGTVTSLKVEPGMTVMLNQWSGDEIEIDGTKHLFVREQDVLAVVG